MANRVDLFAVFGAISGCFQRRAAHSREATAGNAAFFAGPLHFAFIMPR